MKAIAFFLLIFLIYDFVVEIRGRQIKQYIDHKVYSKDEPEHGGKLREILYRIQDIVF